MICSSIKSQRLEVLLSAEKQLKHKGLETTLKGKVLLHLMKLLLDSRRKENHRGLSVRLSFCQFSIFVRNGFLFFSTFLHNDR